MVNIGPAQLSWHYVALWILAIFQGWLILALLWKMERLRLALEHGDRALDGLPIGSRAPRFLAPEEISESTVSLKIFSGHGGAIVFVSTGCSACRDLIAGFMQPVERVTRPIVIVCEGTLEGSLQLLSAAKYPLNVITHNAGDIRSEYRVSSVPTAVLIDSGLTIVRYTHPRTAHELVQTLQESALSTLVADEAQVDPSRSQHQQPLPLVGSGGQRHGS
jgi:hypothetical protein